MPRVWTTISIYLNKTKYNYYSELAKLRGQSRNSMLVQLVDYAIQVRHREGTLLSDWQGEEDAGSEND